jgi:hypothetical protein
MLYREAKGTKRRKISNLIFDGMAPFTVITGDTQ